ncbi:MAG: hypothetical protein AAF206_22270 [Bacteroidota bacterium]
MVINLESIDPTDCDGRISRFFNWLSDNGLYEVNRKLIKQTDGISEGTTNSYLDFADTSFLSFDQLVIRKFQFGKKFTVELKSRIDPLNKEKLDLICKPLHDILGNDSNGQHIEGYFNRRNVFGQITFDWAFDEFGKIIHGSSEGKRHIGIYLCCSQDQSSLLISSGELFLDLKRLESGR